MVYLGRMPWLVHMFLLILKDRGSEEPSLLGGACGLGDFSGSALSGLVSLFWLGPLGGMTVAYVFSYYVYSSACPLTGSWSLGTLFLVGKFCANVCALSGSSVSDGYSVSSIDSGGSWYLGLAGACDSAGASSIWVV